MPAELLVYSIIKDNIVDSKIAGQQVSIDKLVEDPSQVGRYFVLSYSKMIEILLEAENKGYIQLYNNFGHRFVELSDIEPDELINRLYERR